MCIGTGPDPGMVHFFYIGSYISESQDMPTIHSSPTPNPNSLKFTMDDGTFIESGMESFNAPEEAADHELGRRLFAIDGVTNVFILPDFVTVTKEPGARWKDVEAAVEGAVSEYFSTL